MFEGWVRDRRTPTAVLHLFLFSRSSKICAYVGAVCNKSKSRCYFHVVRFEGAIKLVVFRFLFIHGVLNAAVTSPGSSLLWYSWCRYKWEKDPAQGRRCVNKIIPHYHFSVYKETKCHCFRHWKSVSLSLFSSAGLFADIVTLMCVHRSCWSCIC